MIKVRPSIRSTSSSSARITTRNFPPQGIEVVSWYIMMGIGQVVTLRVPASRLREVNRAIEQSAWGAYRTEFYPTYDYKPIAEEQRKTQ